MILKNKKIRCFFFMFLLFFIGHIFYITAGDIIFQKKIEASREDMLKIKTAIGAFYCDWSQLPISDDIFTSTSVYHQRYCDDFNQKIDSDILVLLEELSPQNRVEYLEKYLFIQNQQKNQPNIKSRFANRFLTNLDDCELESIQNIQDMIDPSPKGLWWTPYQELERGRLYSYRKLTTPQAYLKYIPKDPFSNDPPFLFRYGAIMEEGKPFHQFMWILLGNGPDGDADIMPEYIAKDEMGNLVVYQKYPFEGDAGSFWDLVYDPTNGAQSNGDMVLSSLFN